MADEVVCEGFLTKSPPEHKINRARWHRRWFVLRRLRGNIVLQYFKDRNSMKPKGTIDLNNCEQVDQGLSFETRRFLVNAFIFDVVTPRRKYFLVAVSEEDMIRWVRCICEVCGFHLDGADQEEETGVQVTQPMSIHPQENQQEARYTDEPMRSAPTQPNANNNYEEGYFDLSDSISGGASEGAKNTAKSPPESGNERDSGVATLDEPFHRRSYESSDSGGPSDSAPPPPPKPAERTDEGDIYDIPPVYPRHSFSSDSGAIYDCPPARRSSQTIDTFGEMDLYKTVPPPRPSTSSRTSLDFPVSPLKNGSLAFDPPDVSESDIYDVPPAGLPTRQVYDVPPVNFLKGEELSQSTDNLAKTFQNISIRNSLGAHSMTSDSGDLLYDIPGSPVNLNDSGNFTMPSAQDQGPTSPPVDMAPPRPPKPAHMLGPVTPPPSFDDTYNIPQNFQTSSMNALDLKNRLSQEIQGQQSPPAWGSNTHTWQENKPSSIRYINTKRERQDDHSTSGMPLNSEVRNSLDGTIPAPDPESYVNVRNERYVFTPTMPAPVQSSYTPMQGSSGNSTSFDFSESEETYVAMEGSVDNTPADSYTFMQSPSAGSSVTRSHSVSSRNSQGELPPPIRRTMSTSSRNSQGEIPPPINRNSKPDRRSGSLSRSPDLAAMMGMGSYYATPETTESTYDVGKIVPGERTQSFSKKGLGLPTKPESLLQESFRRRTNTADSATSSSGESGVGQEPQHYVTPTDGRHQPTLSDEIYVYKDPAPITPKLEKALAASIQQSAHATKEVTMTTLSETNIPPPIAEEVDTGKIEYLELDHVKMTESPPARPPKPQNMNTVEYVDLDAQKTKALRDVKVERQKDSYSYKSPNES